GRSRPGRPRDRPPLREPFPRRRDPPRTRLAGPPRGRGALAHDLWTVVGPPAPPLSRGRLLRRLPDLLQLPVGRAAQRGGGPLRLGAHDRAGRPLRAAPGRALLLAEPRHGAGGDGRPVDRLAGQPDRLPGRRLRSAPCPPG